LKPLTEGVVKIASDKNGRGAFIDVFREDGAESWSSGWTQTASISNSKATERHRNGARAVQIIRGEMFQEPQRVTVSSGGLGKTPTWAQETRNWRVQRPLKEREPGVLKRKP